MRGSCPASIRRSTTCDPMNPEPPVTRTVDMMGSGLLTPTERNLTSGTNLAFVSSGAATVAGRHRRRAKRRKDSDETVIRRAGRAARCKGAGDHAALLGDQGLDHRHG